MGSDLEQFIKELDLKIKALEEDNYSSNNELIKAVEIKIDDLQNNIDELYKDVLSELDSMIGLVEVKKEVRKLVDYLIFIKKMGDSVKLDSINLNMIFRGNPGTGKTTVARIVANILCKLGFLKTNKVIETTPRDFIAGYVGQTAIKAKNTIQRAEGGVIFVDEAYTFAESKDENNSSFVPEAITEIIKEMESLNTVFIFSGYSNKMDEFIELNPGIKSRVGYDITFSNYTSEELLEMFLNKVTKSGLKISDDAKEEVINKIKDYMTIKNFGNGRMIDNLFDQIIREHASINKLENDNNKLLTITKESVEKVNVIRERGMSFG